MKWIPENIAFAIADRFYGSDYPLQRSQFDNALYEMNCEPSEHPEQPAKEDYKIDWDLYPGNEAGAFDHLDQQEQSSNREEGDILEGISKGEWKIGGTSRGLNNYYIEAGGEKIAQIFSSIPNCEKNADIISKAPELAKENQALRESNTRLKEENKRLMDNMNIACRLALEFGYVECEKGNNIQLAFKNYASCKR